MLKDSILKFFKIDGLIQNLSGYIEARAELLKHEIKEEISKLLSKLSLIFALTIIFLIAIVFMSVGLAFYIGQILNQVLGFIIVGSIYLVLGIIIFIYRDAIAHSLEKKLKEIVEHKKK
jgi:hypothetical protein